MSADPRTLAAYDAQAQAYAQRFQADAPGGDLCAFMALLPPGGQVLDLGCGPGTASAFLRAAGFMPDPVDASPAMVEIANNRYGIGARLATFDEIDAEAAYDGVWANFSLLHAPRADLPGHLTALKRALRPGGILHLGMKTGTGEGRDRLDRFYSYFSRAELLSLLAAAGFTVTATREDHEIGLAGTDEPFIILLAHG